MTCEAGFCSVEVTEEVVVSVKAPQRQRRSQRDKQLSWSGAGRWPAVKRQQQLMDLSSPGGRAACWYMASWQCSLPSTPDLYFSPLRSRERHQTRFHSKDRFLCMDMFSRLYIAGHACCFLPSQVVSRDSDWCSSSCDSLKLSARLNDERRNPSEVTAHVHHRSLCALIVLFKAKLYLPSSVSFLDNKQLRPQGKILHDSCCRCSVSLNVFARSDQIEFRVKSEWLTAPLERKLNQAGTQFPSLIYCSNTSN